MSESPNLLALADRRRMVAGEEARAIERAMQSFRREYGTNERLIGTDFLSRKLILPRPEFLARVVMKVIL
jgi:hypothetical protein